MSRGKTPGYGMCSWEQLPKYMRTKETKEFYDLLCKKRGQLAVKRVFDVVVASLLLALLSPFLLALSVWIKADSKGPVFFRQVRITQYGRKFRIFKFRTMVQDAQKYIQQNGTIGEEINDNLKTNNDTASKTSDLIKESNEKQAK